MTRNGYKLLTTLTELGWKIVPWDDDTIGDPLVEDPRNGKRYNIYAAIEIDLKETVDES